MKIQFNLTGLKKAFATLLPVLNDDNALMPHMGLIAMDMHENTIRFRACSSEFYIVHLLDVDDFVTVKSSDLQQKTIVFPGRKLYDLLNKITSLSVNIQFDEKDAKLQAKGFSFAFTYGSSDTFTPIPTLKDAIVLPLHASQLQHAYRKTSYAANNAAEAKMAITKGVHHFFEANQFIIMATDRNRLSAYTMKTDTEHNKIIIVPIQFVTLIEKQLSQSSHIAIHAAENNIAIEINSSTYYCNLIADKPLDYHKIIPVAYPIQAIIDTQALRNALSKAMLCPSEKMDVVHLYINPKSKQCRIETPQQSTGSMREDILLLESEGENVSIIAKTKFLIEAVQRISNEQTLIQLTHKKGIFQIIDPSEKENHVQIILPMNQPETMNAAIENFQCDDANTTEELETPVAV